VTPQVACSRRRAASAALTGAAVCGAAGVLVCAAAGTGVARGVGVEVAAAVAEEAGISWAVVLPSSPHAASVSSTNAAAAQAQVRMDVRIAEARCRATGVTASGAQQAQGLAPSKLTEIGGKKVKWS
jgi:hypothetical protein